MISIPKSEFKTGGKKPTKSISVLNSKEGRIKNLMGKRVGFSAESVITNKNIDIDVFVPSNS